METCRSPRNEINMKFIKWSGGATCQKIAYICNIVPETSEYPNEIIHGVLRPIRKPAKPKCLFPLVYHFIITTACIMRKINKSLDSHFPLLQVAYRKHWLITRNVFRTKLVIEWSFWQQRVSCVLGLSSVKRSEHIKNWTYQEVKWVYYFVLDYNLFKMQVNFTSKSGKSITLEAKPLEILEKTDWTNT